MTGRTIENHFELNGSEESAVGEEKRYKTRRGEQP